MDVFQRYLLILTATWAAINLGHNIVYGAALSTFDVTGQLGDDYLSLKCGFTIRPGDTGCTITLRRKRGNENKFSDVAEFHFIGIKRYIYLDSCLKQRTTLKQTSNSASIIFNELHRSDDGVYQCDLFYYDINLKGNRSVETMTLSVKEPSSPRVRIDAGVVRSSDDVSLPKGQVHMKSMGIGITVGLFVMLAVVMVCLVLVFVFREKTAVFLSVINNKIRKGDKSVTVKEDLSVNQVSRIYSKPERIYDEPVERDEERFDYDHLQMETRQSPSYDKIRSYFNI